MRATSDVQDNPIGFLSGTSRLLTFAQLATGFRIRPATAHRSITEAIEVLATLAPALGQAMAATKAFVILDGTLLSIDTALPIDRIERKPQLRPPEPRRTGQEITPVMPGEVSGGRRVPHGWGGWARHGAGIRYSPPYGL